MTKYKKNIDTLKANLTNLPKFWDGKTCILELKEADYQWRQMVIPYLLKNIIRIK